MLRIRERRTSALYQIVKIMASGRSKNDYLPAVSQRLGDTLNGDCFIILCDDEGTLIRKGIPSAGSELNDKEWAVAQWASEHARPAGWSTDTLPSGDCLYMPLHGATLAAGVLAYRPRGKMRLLQEEENLLATVARQLAISLERELLQDRSRKAESLAESERLYQTILNSVSHEIRTPLTAIIGFTSALGSDPLKDNPQSREEILKELGGSAERLNGVVTNLLDLSRLNSGMLSLNKDWHDINDLIAVILDESKKILANHHVNLKCRENLPLIRVDFYLFKQAVVNILANAAAYASPNTSIDLETWEAEGSIILRITDDGPGIPAEAVTRLFDKFYRVPGTSTGGIGIGLAISRAIIEMHGGKIEAANAPNRGACFTIKLPIEKQPELPTEGTEK